MFNRTLAGMLGLSLAACSSMPSFQSIPIPWLKRDAAPLERLTVGVLSIIPEEQLADEIPKVFDTANATAPRTFDIQNAVRTAVAGTVAGAGISLYFCSLLLVLPPAYAACAGTGAVIGGITGAARGGVHGPKEDALREIDALIPDLPSAANLAIKLHHVLIEQARLRSPHEIVDLGTVTVAQYRERKPAAVTGDTLTLQLRQTTGIPGDDMQFHVVVRAAAKRNNSIWSKLWWGRTYEHQSPAISRLASPGEKLASAQETIEVGFREIARSIIDAELMQR